ncbi:hypothetical protein Gpo141_00006223 [Globisporangium polare]
MKDLTLEQKAIVRMNVSRETAEGFVKCCYCEKEISSRNVDRWGSHLRGCVKTPEEVKAQIVPIRVVGGPNAGTSAPTAGNGAHGSASAAAAASGSAAAMFAAGHSLINAQQGSANPSTSPFLAHTATGNLQTALSSSYNEVFKVHVSKDYMKFNAAHFIAYKGFREKLHGHNYRLAVTITGGVGPDGYVVDFGEIKKISRVICKDLNESFLVPMNSDALKITFDGTNVHILTEDQAKFSFPKADCSLLPIVHSSAEELAIYISNQIVDAFTLTALLARGVRKLEVSISEATQQFASYERAILG